MEKRIYISGKITGEDYEKTYKKFLLMEQKILSQSTVENPIKVINPMKICKPEWNWEQCMRVCISKMLLCHEVWLLPDWVDSRGAKKEVCLCQEYGIKIVTT